MLKIPFYQYLSISLTIFAMTFGAGNLIYPLATGYSVKSQFIWGIVGFSISSVLIPFFGLIATSLYNGNYRSFLQHYLGMYLANIITMCSMLLLGPTGCIPRCVLFAYSTLNTFYFIPKVLFVLLFMGLCYVLALEKSNLIRVLGRIIAPITVGCCFVLIVIGFVMFPGVILQGANALQSLSTGLYNGCFTFDLLAMIFYSRVVYHLTEKTLSYYNSSYSKYDVVYFLIKAGLLASFIFIIIYGGMISIAAFHAKHLGLDVSHTDLFALIAKYLLGFQTLGAIQAIIVVLACFSASFSLLVVFADYLTLINNDISYKNAVFITAAMSVILGFLELHHIHAIMKPLVIIAYPLLIVCSIVVVFQLLVRRYLDIDIFTNKE